MHKQIVSSSIWMFFGNSAQQVLQLVVFVLLARQLSPDVFGHVALASVAIDIATAVGGWGVVDFLTQRRHASKNLLGHTHAFSIALGLVLSATVAIGVAVYTFFKGFSLVPELVLMMIPIIVVQAFGLVPEATIRRSLDFKWLALRNNLAAVLGGGAALILAFTNFGVYALVVQKLIALCVLSATVWIAAGKNVPVLKFAAYKKKIFLLVFENGFKISSQPLSALLANRLIDGIIGIYLGTIALGQYKMVIRIYEMITQLTISPINIVAFSAFPKVASDVNALRTLSIQMIDICLLLFVPMLAGLGATASLWVPVILGSDWFGAIPMLQIVCCMSAATVFVMFQTPLFLSFKMNDFLLRQSAIRLIIVAIGCLISAQYTIETVAIFTVMQTYGFALYNVYKLNRLSNWLYLDDLKMILPAASASAVMVLAIFFTKSLVPADMHIVPLILEVMLGAITYAGFYFIFFNARAVKIISNAQNYFNKRPVHADDTEKFSAL